MTEYKYTAGKIDYNNTGKKNHRVEISWELKDGKFSMSGSIWDPRETDTVSGGQNLEEIAALFPADPQVQSMVRIWRAWHLNDMTAGSPAQEAWLAANPAGLPGFDFKARSECLTKAGLNPDPNFLHNGKSYVYGSAWLKRDLPAEVLEEIGNWKNTLDYTLDKETKAKQPKKSAFAKFLEKNFVLTCEYEGFENNMDCYNCTIQRIVNSDPHFHGKKTGAKMKTEWKQGTGHRLDKSGRKWSAREDFADFTLFGWRKFDPKKSAPSLVKVMEAVVSDALAYQDNGDVADFISNFGYEDFRKGRRVWQACEEQYSKLRNVSGSLFHKLLDADYTGEEAA